MIDAKRFPLDFDVLEKGSVVTRAEIEHIYRVTYGTDQYSLKALALGQAIETMLDARGLCVTVKIDKGELRILTDAEASEYNRCEAMRGFKRMMRRHRKGAEVQIDNLTPAQAIAHDRGLQVSGAMIFAAKKAKKEALRALPYERQTPFLLDMRNDDDAETSEE